MTKKLNLGVLGVSAHFINRILLPLSLSDKVEIHGIASRSEDKAKEASKKWNIPKYYGSYEALLADDSIEAVYIPLPNHMHLEWIKKAADAKKHIICEKPLTMDASETLEIMSYLKDKPIKLVEAFMYRFHPKWQRAKELVTFNEIGKITAIHSVFSYNNVDPKNIRNIKDFGGGALMDIGCYAISSARYLLGREPVKVVSSMQEHPDFKTDFLSSAILDFGDARCLFTVSTSSFPQQEVKVYGTGGALTVTVPFNDYNDVKGEIIVQNGLGTRRVIFDPINQYKLQFDGFADAIYNDTDVLISLEDSYMNMKIIDALMKSNENGQWVTI